MKYSIDVTEWKLLDLNNFCIINNLNIEITKEQVKIPILEVRIDQ